ncbi:sporulation protein YlmC with PRC-barrel domain [Bosea sp. OAE506]|uniref:PRC-barrel domain-containing protein n=1 Tax=Bosea sp. OAE506 TaxID=2663870 RepID=UPI001789B71D
MFTRSITTASLALALMGATAIAQTTAPAPSAAPAAPSATMAPSSTTAVAPANTSWQGKWRATQLIGVDIYGPDNAKVGDVTEVLFDKTGKIEMVTVGVGGFLGIGSKDVAIPFSQVNWSETPMASAAPASGMSSGTAGTGTGTAGGTAATAPAGTATGTAATNRAPMMYPDHGKITMTKAQLSDAPAVNYSGS